MIRRLLNKLSESKIRKQVSLSVLESWSSVYNRHQLMTNLTKLTVDSFLECIEPENLDNLSKYDKIAFDSIYILDTNVNSIMESPDPGDYWVLRSSSVYDTCNISIKKTGVYLAVSNNLLGVSSSVYLGSDLSDTSYILEGHRVYSYLTTLAVVRNFKYSDNNEYLPIIRVMRHYQSNKNSSKSMYKEVMHLLDLETLSLGIQLLSEDEFRAMCRYLCTNRSSVLSFCNSPSQYEYSKVVKSFTYGVDRCRNIAKNYRRCHMLEE